MNRKQAQGFTLTEIVIVLAIISILAAVSIPLYQNYTRKTKAAEAWEELTHIAALQDQIFTDLRVYDTDGTKLPAYGASFQGKYFTVQSISGTDGWTAQVRLCFDGKVPCPSPSPYMFSINQSGQKKTSVNGGTIWTNGWSL